MTDKTTIEILKGARELIAAEGAWGKYAYERNGCLCAFGAINVAQSKDACDVDALDPAALAFARTIGAVTPEDAEGVIYDWNDQYHRTQAEVVAKFDEAIAAEEAKAGAT